MPPSPNDGDLEAPIASTSAAAQDESSQEGYMYTQELSQMMFVFAHVEEPSKAVLHLLEDIVRHQVVQMIIQARNLSVLRRSRHLSTEDLIFLVRYDRAKVNRLRTYLSWKDVRKNAKDDGGGGTAGDVDLNAAVEDADMAKAQGGISRKLKVKLPWEISTIYSDYIIPGAGSNADSSNGGRGTVSDLPPELEAAAAKVQQPTVDEELDEDDQEAMRESLMRLKEADEATLKMTREEYEHYSDCRTASFTFRKGKKFREFLSSSSYLDVKPNDDIVDILGFLAYEVVREITIGAKKIWEQERALLQRQQRQEPKMKKAKTTHSGNAVTGEGTTTSLEEVKGKVDEKEMTSLNAADAVKEEDQTIATSTIVSPPSKIKPKGAKSGKSGGVPSSQAIANAASREKEGGEVDVQQLYSTGHPSAVEEESFGLDSSSFCGLFSLGNNAGPTSGEGDKASSPSDPRKGVEDVAVPASKAKRPHVSDGGEEESEAMGGGEDREVAEEGGSSSGDGSEQESSPDLLVHHIRESLARMERCKTQPSLSAGVRVSGPIGGLRKTKVFVM